MRLNSPVAVMLVMLFSLLLTSCAPKTIVIAPLGGDDEMLSSTHWYKKQLNEALRRRAGSFNVEIRQSPLSTHFSDWTEEDYAILAKWMQSEDITLFAFGEYKFGATTFGFYPATGRQKADSHFYLSTLYVIPMDRILSEVLPRLSPPRR